MLNTGSSYSCRQDQYRSFQRNSIILPTAIMNKAWRGSSTTDDKENRKSLISLLSKDNDAEPMFL
ncbi:hypothetical protein DPMN_104050 [Dreissena polymorpha]|uniref:Uncharacterized protein n=1 Tax=Dreissena polymorpha TaxID=45954 RepID=A0A9D4K2L0_DREPO|nr:hypothetical protein DPMN_104050 [Dreissena polymorpha]